MPNPDRFQKMDVPVVLTGEEWTAVLGRLIRRELSPEGAVIYNRATGKIQTQILAASRRSQLEVVKS